MTGQNAFWLRANKRSLLVVLMLLLTPLIAGAAYAERSVESYFADLSAEIRELGLEPGEIIQPLQVNEEMITWAQERVPRSAPEVFRLRILLEALQGSKKPLFEYQSGYTGSAEEVFASGKFNCLSFSMLFVALSRNLGLPAYYLNVKQVQEFERHGDLVVMSRHITAGYGFVKDRTILEFDVGPEINYYLADPISDLDALALYYSNRGAELLRDGEPEAAEEELKTAVILGPGLSQGWVNLGVAQRRVGKIEAAQEAYLKAIDLERSNIPAYENLATLFRRQGKMDAAIKLIEILDQRKNRNPFTFLALGDTNLRQGRIKEAERFYRRALRLARHEAETHAAMGQWALATGQRDKARGWLKRARNLDAENERMLFLQQRLAPGGSNSKRSGYSDSQLEDVEEAGLEK